MHGLERAVCYEFGDFRLDAARRVLHSNRSGSRVTISPKVFDAALFFVEHSGQLLAKEQLLAELWPGLIVEENNLTHLISVLRHAFGEAHGQNQYIVTIPRRGYRFVAAVRRASTPAVSGSTQRVFAVLPFVVIGDDPRNVTIAAGTTEDLSHRLASVRGVKVIAYSTSGRRWYAPPDGQAMTQRLAADYRVEGSVQISAQQLRVTAQLIDAREGAHVWSLMFNQALQDALAVQDAIAQQIVEAIERTLDAAASA